MHKSTHPWAVVLIVGILVVFICILGSVISTFVEEGVNDNDTTAFVQDENAVLKFDDDSGNYNAS
ncbi:MAG: hypothetical protein LUB61_04800 [Eggerthellaceae bacterium]|nr:hypothetical protein [Eggerthellaceae bacterium]